MACVATEQIQAITTLTDAYQRHLFGVFPDGTLLPTLIGRQVENQGINNMLKSGMEIDQTQKDLTKDDEKPDGFNAFNAPQKIIDELFKDEKDAKKVKEWWKDCLPCDERLFSDAWKSLIQSGGLFTKLAVDNYLAAALKQLEYLSAIKRMLSGMLFLDDICRALKMFPPIICLPDLMAMSAVIAFALQDMRKRFMNPFQSVPNLKGKLLKWLRSLLLLPLLMAAQSMLQQVLGFLIRPLQCLITALRADAAKLTQPSLKDLFGRNTIKDNEGKEVKPQLGVFGRDPQVRALQDGQKQFDETETVETPIIKESEVTIENTLGKLPTAAGTKTVVKQLPLNQLANIPGSAVKWTKGALTDIADFLQKYKDMIEAQFQSINKQIQDEINKLNKEQQDLIALLIDLKKLQVWAELINTALALTKLAVDVKGKWDNIKNFKDLCDRIMANDPSLSFLNTQAYDYTKKDWLDTARDYVTDKRSDWNRMMDDAMAGDPKKPRTDAEKGSNQSGGGGGKYNVNWPEGSGASDAGNTVLVNTVLEPDFFDNDIDDIIETLPFRLDELNYQDLPDGSPDPNRLDGEFITEYRYAKNIVKALNGLDTSPEAMQFISQISGHLTVARQQEPSGMIVAILSTGSCLGDVDKDAQLQAWLKELGVENA